MDTIKVELDGTELNKTESDKTESNGTKPDPVEFDTTVFKLSPATHEELLLAHANGRSTTPQMIVNITIKKGGGVEFETMDKGK